MKKIYQGGLEEFYGYYSDVMLQDLKEMDETTVVVLNDDTETTLKEFVASNKFGE